MDMRKEYTFKGYIARDSCNGDESDLYMGVRKPYREDKPYDDDSIFSTNITWIGFGEFMAIPSEMFPELNPTDEPIEVEIIIREKDASNT